jgi:hypothetical protein
VADCGRYTQTLLEYATTLLHQVRGRPPCCDEVCAPDGASGHLVVSATPPTGSTWTTSVPSWASVMPPSGAATTPDIALSRRPASGAVAGMHPRLVRKQAELALQTQVVNLVPVGDNLAVTQMLDL